MPTMKHILRKLHIGGSHDNFGDRHHEVGGRILDNGENSTGVSGHTETDQRLSSGISGWLNTARHTLRPSHVSHGGSRPRLNSPGAASASSDASRTRSQDADDRIGFQYYEEEYQVQLALALSVSNSDVRDDPESVQIRAAKRISLGRPPSPGNTPAEFIAQKYRNYNVLDYQEKVVDGFYDVYGVVSDFGAMPSLVDLQGTPVTDNLGYEVILVNRAMDPDLVQLEQTALCLALDCGSGEASSYQSCLIQKIADLVVEHMGGRVTETTDMLKRWRIRNYELHGSLNDIVLPLGCLRVGLSRHRALLYKVLADHVGVPCRLVKGSHYTGTDEGAVNIVKLDNGREYIIDLMGAPGTLLPAEVVGATLQIDQVDSDCIVDNRNLPNRIEETVLSSSNGESRPFNGPSDQCGHANSFVDHPTEDVGKNSNEGSLYNEPAKVGSAVALPEWFEKGVPDFISCWEHGSTIEGDIKGTLLKVIENVPQETVLRKIHAKSFGVDQLGPCQVAERIKLTMSEKSDRSFEFLKPLKGNGFENQYAPFSSRTTSLLPMAMVDDLQAAPESSAQVPTSAVLTAKACKTFDSIVAAVKADLLKEMERPNTWISARKDASSVTLSAAAHSLPQLAEQSGDCLLREMPATADKICSHIELRDGRYTRNNGGNSQADFQTNADEEIRGKEQKILKSHDYPSGKASPVLDDVAEWEIPWEDITIGDRIGLGSYGEVYHGIWHGTQVAVKKLLDQGLSGDALDDFISEVRIMRRMQHPNVILFIGAVTRPPNLSIVTEYLPRGSLFRLLHHPHNQLDEKVRLKMALDVAKGMNYLHTSVPVIVHRDLKSPNLLVDKNWVVKVCDFGLSRTKHRTFLSSRSTAGTPEWMAPEVLRNEPSNEKCDVYSFGVILWELVTLQEPWSWMNPMQVVGAVGFQSRRLELPKNVDPTVASIIHECWQSDPRKRPSFAQLITALKSLQRLNVVQLLN